MCIALHLFVLGEKIKLKSEGIRRKSWKNSLVIHKTKSLEPVPGPNLSAPRRPNGKSATSLLIRRLICRNGRGSYDFVFARGECGAVVSINTVAVGAAVRSDSASTGEGFYGPVFGIAASRRERGGSREGCCKSGEEDSGWLHYGERGLMVGVGKMQ